MKETPLPNRADRMIAYCMTIAEEFQSRINQMQVFVKHNLSSGNANEIILREFLAMHAPGNVHVGQGFICDPTEDNKVSRQCDILIYDQSHYPVVYADGPVKVVWPDAARMVIEVKTNFNKEDITSALENINEAKRLNHQLVGLIFAFKSPRLSTVLKHLQAYEKQVEPDNGPTAVFLLDKGIIIHCWKLSRMRDLGLRPIDEMPNTYAVRVGKGNKSAIVITFLLFLFFQAVSSGLDWAFTANMLLDMIEEHSEREEPDIHIGPHP